ncbi:MAG: hypothetical protein ACOC8I_04495, partial [Desulfosalsimonas sp.]
MMPFLQKSALASDHLVLVGFEDHWLQVGPNPDAPDDLDVDPYGDDYWMAHYIALEGDAFAENEVDSFTFTPPSEDKTLDLEYDADGDEWNVKRTHSELTFSDDFTLPFDLPGIFEVELTYSSTGEAEWTGPDESEFVEPVNPVFTGPAGSYWDEDEEGEHLVINLADETTLEWNSSDFSDVFEYDGEYNHDSILFILLDVTGDDTELYRDEQNKLDFDSYDLGKHIEDGGEYVVLVDFVVARILFDDPPYSYGELDDASQGYARGYNTLIRIKVINYSEFAGGDGTEDDPYRIATPEHLDNIRNYPADSSYILVNDIDLEDYLSEDGDGYNDGKRWEPIRVGDDCFDGSLSGNGFSISNIYINRPDSDYVGLFGCGDPGGKLDGIGLEDVEIEGRYDVGALIGFVSIIEDNENFIMGGIPLTQLTPISCVFCHG